jgi:protein-tyrosine phosphatase
MVKVLFVCMGNICRSPMAEAVFRHLVTEAGLADQFEIDSAGTHEYHIGARPHPGTQRILAAHGVAVGDQRARHVHPYDVDYFDYIIAMDGDNATDLKAVAPDSTKVARLLDFAPHAPVRNVPDPYYVGNFEAVYDLVLAGARGLLAHIVRERHLQNKPPAGSGPAGGQN